VEGHSNIGQARQYDIVGGGKRHGDFGWEPRDGVRDAVGVGGKHPNSIASVRVKCRAGIPAVFGVGAPGGPVHRFFMDEDVDAQWSDRGAVEVKVAIELGPGRKFRIKAGAAE
jgi:hypothetical protein